MIRDALSPLSEREFRLLFFGRLVSFLGSAVAPVALAFAILDDLDGSASELGLVLTATWVPQIVFILVGGVVADRLPRHLVLVGSNVVSAAMQGAAGFLILTDAAEIWHLFAIQLVRGTVQAFFFPAAVGIVPQTVSAAQLQQANVLLRMSTNATFIVGAAVGGLAVAAVGPGWALVFDGATYLASALLLLPMNIEGNVKTEASFLGQIGEGWREFKSREWLWVIVLAALFGNMIWSGCVNVLGPVVAKESLGGADAWGLVLSLQSVGLIVGGVIAARLRPRRILLVAQCSILLMPVFFVGLALGTSPVVVAAAAFVAGIGLELFGVFWDTAMQQHVPRHALSRVSSYDALGSFVAIPLGLTIAGPLSEIVGVETLLWGAALAYVTVNGTALLSRDVRTLERTDAAPGHA